MLRRLLLAASVLLLFPPLARAADQTVLGKQLQVKNPSTPDKRQILLQAAEDATDNTLVGDPTLNGAAVTISLYGGTAASQVFPLPQGTNAKGKPFWSGDATKGFAYKDPKGEQGPVKLAQLKIKSGKFQLKVLISGKNGSISAQANAASSGACTALSITGGDSYSVRFADGTVTNKVPTLFKIKDPTTQGTCAATCGNGFVDAGEQCEGPGSSCGGSAVCQSDCTCPCDFLDQTDCLLPFPSDYLTVADGTTDTGRRVNFHLASMPKNASNVSIDPTAWNLNDGFSQGAAIIVHVPNVDLTQTNAAPITDIARSLDSNAPVVLINADTLQRQLMFVELDVQDTNPATQAMFIHPGVNLEEGGHYIVAMRNMKDGTGATIPAGADFAAYRDNTPTGVLAKELRRPHMEDIFATLASAGIARNDLYLAWDFTVASQDNITGRLLAIRDDAFQRLGTSAPSFTVSSVNNEFSTKIFRRVQGTYQVERYVDSTTAGAKFVLGPNGLPTHQVTTQPAVFDCIIPRAALANAMATSIPARASIYGHGLLGSNTEVEGGNVQSMANEHNFVFCATKWIGMADEDVSNAVGILQDLSKFPTLTDRLQQAMINQLFLARLMIHPNGFVSDPAFQDAMGNPVIDTSAVYYDGNSQGGIFGGTVMSIAQDITRGVLGVPGMNYSLLLPRSTDFATYNSIYVPSYPSALQRMIGLGLIQMLWDRSDPNGYIRHVTNDPLPNTPSHDVLLHLAFGDHQVANVSTEIEARTLGASIHTPTIAAGRNPDVVPYYGIPGIPSYPFSGSALIVWDSGAATPPITDTAPTTGTDPHSAPRNSVIARQQKSDFLQAGGAVTDVCLGLPCVPTP